MPLDSFAAINQSSFSARDLQGIDQWTTWTPTYSFTTATSLTVTGRFRVVGRQCFFQVKSSGTSLATTVNVSYINMPMAVKGNGGIGSMTNRTTHTAVGIGDIDPDTSCFYPPTQAASGNTFTFAGWFEV